MHKNGPVTFGSHQKRAAGISMSEDLCNRTDRYTKNECERELRLVLPPPAHYFFLQKKGGGLRHAHKEESIFRHTHTRLKIAAKIDGERIMLKASGQWAPLHVQRESPGGENEQYHFCVYENKGHGRLVCTQKTQKPLLYFRFEKSVFLCADKKSQRKVEERKEDAKEMLPG